MKLHPKTTAPIAVLLVATAVTAAMFAARSEVEQVKPAVYLPTVEVISATPGRAEPRIRAHGSVEPRTESDLVAEVSGRVVWVSPQLASGGFFAADEPLARIDPRDYEIALAGARASLARSESDRRHALANLERQKSMREQGVSSRSRHDDAVHAAAVARAALEEARVAVARAELDLERVEISAPYAGRVRTKHLDIGQFVARGAPVARIYAVDYAEVRLPVSAEDASFLALPEGFPAPSGEEAVADPVGPRVLLRAQVAGRPQTWEGTVVRTEAALDPRTRMTNLVARVEDPYGLKDDAPDRAPLAMGLFVEAEIAGRPVDGLIEVPRRALRERDGALVLVDPNGRLQLRGVDVFRAERERVWIRAGLEAGEAVVTTPLDVVVEGMQVETERGELAAPADETATRPEPRT